MVMYFRKEDYENALNNALSREKLNDPGIAKSYYNIGYVFIFKNTNMKIRLFIINHCINYYIKIIRILHLLIIL
jgi:hypothetical protein